MFLMCIKEKFGKFYLLYCSLLGILTIWIEKTLSYGILFTLILFTAIQIARMVCFPAINCINNGFASFRIQKAKNTLILSLLANLPWLFFIIIKTWMSNLTMLLPIILIWIYCTILGTLIGIYIKNEIISYAIMLLCFFFCIQKILIHELYFRYISPVLIFRGQLYSYNLLGIIIFSAFSIAILLVLKKKQKIILLLMMLLCFVALTFYEINKETIIENTKTKLTSNCNYDMCIDELLLKIWGELDENNSRS